MQEIKENLELIKLIIKKPFADTQDIMILTNTKETKAREVKALVLEELAKKGTPMFDKRYVPMDKLLKKINFNKTYFEAQNERV